MLSTRPPMTDSLGSRGRSRQPGMTVGFQLRTRPGWLDGLMDPVVRVSGGLVRGSSRDGVNSFLGIPYAGPAVGGDRYRAPLRVAPWGGERDATAPGPTAAQSAYPPPMDTVLPSSVAPGDDYLNVSVWAPAEGGSRPVMVWIHGGAFVRGASELNPHLQRVRVRPRRRRAGGDQLPARRP